METQQAGFGRSEAALFVMVVVAVAGAFGVLSFSYFNGSGLWNNSAPSAVPQGFGVFQSYSQLQSFVTENAGSAQRYGRQGIVFGGPLPVIQGVAPILVEGAPADTFAAAIPSAASTPTYTGTNVQVQGVDEPDSVKTDGLHLFVASGDTLAIISAYPPNSTSIISSLSFGDASILGIEISPGRLLVFSQRTSNTTYVDMLLYNDSTLSSPQLMENMSVAGTYVAARLAQGYAYAVIQQPSYIFDSEGRAIGVLPVVVENGASITLPPALVYYTPNHNQISYYTMVVSLSMSTGMARTVSVLTGPSSTVYVSLSDIYVVYTNYQEFYADGIPGDIYTGGVITSSDLQQGANSTIFRASYANGTVTVAAVGTVPGTVLNQFSLDEYEGYFRVATSRFVAFGDGYTTSDDIYVLDQNMSQVSALRNIAPGENIYAVSFVGAMGYVVTFEQVDPLFAISFQNPAAPVILSSLKVNGYSDYLYPLPDGYLIGVGKNTVPSSTGNFSYYLGLKLSLFRVLSNGTSVQVSDYLIGDRGTDSPVLDDHLAFTYDSSDNITVIPVLLAEVGGNQSYAPGSPPPFGDYVWQGVYVLKVTQDGFALLGRISQYPAGLNYGDSSDGSLQIDRSVVIGSYLYTVSQSEVMVSDLSNFSTVATILLPT